jgi:hypothetical protein
MGMSLGIGLGIGMRSPPTGLTCPASIPLSSGVAASVSVPSGDRWLRFVGSQSGGRVLTIAGTTGNPDVTIYYGTCDSLTQLTTFTGNSTYTTLVLGAGVVVYVKLTGTAATATVTAAMWTPANGSPYIVVDPLASGGAFSDAGTTPAVVGDLVYQMPTNLYGGSIGGSVPLVQATSTRRPTLRSDGLEFPLTVDVGCIDFASTVQIGSGPYTLYCVGYRPAAGVAFIPWGNRNLSTISAPKSSGIWYTTADSLTTSGDGITSTTASRTENGLLCVRVRRQSDGASAFIKVTGAAEIAASAGVMCFQTVGARPKTTAAYNTSAATRYRGWVAVTGDTVEDGTSALWEAWIAANWGVGP